MRILVANTDSYIGSRLAPVLFGRGHDVVGLDRDRRVAVGCSHSDRLRIGFERLDAACGVVGLEPVVRPHPPKVLAAGEVDETVEVPEHADVGIVSEQPDA